MSRFLSVCLMVLCVSLPVFAQPIYVNEKSGYTTTTQLVGTRYLFKRHTFLETDFDVWLPVVYRAQAFELFQSLVKENKISKQGFVLMDITVGSTVFPRSTILDIEMLTDALPKTFDGAVVLKELTTATVIDSKGQVIGIETATTLETANFSSLNSKLQAVAIPVQSEKLKASLINDLSSLIISYHQEQEVTTQDQTRYQSRNDNIFVGLMESMLGNAMASWFQPDKTRVNTVKNLSLPESIPSRFYPITVGLSPFYHQKNGLWSINGNPTIWRGAFTTLSTKDNKMIEAGLSTYWLLNPGQPYSNTFYTPAATLGYAQVENAGVVKKYYSVAIPYLSMGTFSKGGVSNWYFGPSMINTQTGNALGMMVGLDMETTFLNQFTFDLGSKFYFQPQLNGSNCWDQLHATAGFSWYVSPQVSFQVGYQWWMSSTDVNDSGLTLGMKFVY